MPQAWEPFEPRAGQWTLKLAAHLLRRATFGFTGSQLQQALADGPQKTVDRLLAQPPDYAAFEQSIASIAPRESNPRISAELALYRAINSPHPFQEKTALFGATPDWLLRLAPIKDPGTILRSNAFFSQAAYRQRAKTPIEFALNLSIALGVQLAPAQLRGQLEALGERIPEPFGSKRWLNSFTLIGRSNLAASIAAKVDRFPDRRSLLETLLQNDAPAATLDRLASLDGRELVQAIVNLPEYQLA